MVPRFLNKTKCCSTTTYRCKRFGIYWFLIATVGHINLYAALQIEMMESYRGVRYTESCSILIGYGCTMRRMGQRFCLLKQSVLFEGVDESVGM